MSNFQSQKGLISDYFKALAQWDVDSGETALEGYFTKGFNCYACYPFNEIEGAQHYLSTIWRPLKNSLTNMQRRQDIFIAGEDHKDKRVWVLSMGHLMGLFDKPWLNIQPSYKTSMLRYAEFFAVENNKIVAASFFVDIIGFMQQAGLQPLPVQTGADFLVPGPLTHDGLLFEPQPVEQGLETLALVNRMVDDLSALNLSGDDRCPPGLLAKTWHHDMVWYGPAGIGTSHTIERYQQHHQYPFREGLKDKQFNGHIARFAEGNYACFFGWPNLSNTPKGGWLGLPGGEVRGDMRVVDVYRRDGDKLAENWVIMDLPYWLKQQGLDIIERTTQIHAPTTN